MVEASMNARRLLWSLAALAALAYLTAMVISGALPEQRQLIKFEAQGLMKLPPERISRIELTRGERTARFVRTGESGWILEDRGPVPKPLAEKLTLAVQIMNRSGPVRLLEPAEYRNTDLREFGLDKPLLSFVLAEGASPVMQAKFGALTPDKILRYMTVEGRQELFLMSLFVGDTWAAIADEVFAK
jgi:hypothetical protein